MKKSIEKYRRGRTCVFMMHVHLVFVCKYRRNVFTGRVMHELNKIFSKVCNDFESDLLECNGENDYVHLLINYPPKYPISSLVNSLKGVSSRMIRKKGFPEVTKSLWGRSLWSPSYFAASCGGAPVSVIKKYIEEQRPSVGELLSPT
jgi:putative transposase